MKLENTQNKKIKGKEKENIRMTLDSPYYSARV